ncbi:adenine nucleotide transporter 1 [Actinidia rufa]|uniref:Adenine nucleotide transporter 1 n=1 Tax=Actinidia rufa TaxID=165716 RepID=A0A7J0FTM4_9ERIC|nr:adenine nucleotide transporter 1 [Actinidia rufa]
MVRFRMASEDVVAKTSETAVSTIVNLAEEAKIAREGVKAPSHAFYSIYKSLVAGARRGVTYCCCSIRTVKDFAPEDTELTPLLRLGAGACTGIIAMLATYPMDMVRGRLAVQTEASPRQYRGIFHALSTVFREEGPRALYKVWLPSVIGVQPVASLSVGLGCGNCVFCLSHNPFDSGQSPEGIAGTERSQPTKVNSPRISLTSGNGRHSTLLIAEDTHATKPHT